MRLEGAILAGGASRRMGRDKALLVFEGKPVLDRIAEALLPLVPRIRVIGRDRVPSIATSSMDAQPDLHPGLGPLSGIHTALATAEADAVVVVACDLPFVTTSFFRGLVDRLSPESEAVVPCPRGEPVAVCALYRRFLKERLEARLARRELRAKDFVRSISARLVGDDELRDLDPEGRHLTSWNTPEEYELLTRARNNESKT